MPREPRDLLGSTFPVLGLEMCTFEPGFPLGLRSSMLTWQGLYTEPLPLPVILDFLKLYVCSGLRESWSHGCEGKGDSGSSEAVKSMRIIWASCSRVDGWLLSWRLPVSSPGIIIVHLCVCISSSPCLPMLYAVHEVQTAAWRNTTVLPWGIPRYVFMSCWDYSQIWTLITSTEVPAVCCSLGNHAEMLGIKISGTLFLE